MSHFIKHHPNDISTHDHINKSNHNIKKDNEIYVKDNTSVLKFVFCMVLSFAFVELFTALWTNSLALLADFFHMITDSMALLFALIMNILSRKPANEKYSYGHGRADTIGAFVNAFFMILVVIFILYEAIIRLLNPVQVNGIGVFIVALIGLFINIIALKLLHGGESLNTKAAFIHIMGDLLGSIAAIISGLVIYQTGFMPVDPILSIIVAIIILFPSIKILKQTVKILMEAVPEGICLNAVGSRIESIEGILSIHDLHIWTMSSNDIAMSAHIHVKDLNEWDEILIELQKLLIKEFDISHITLQPEVC